MFEFITDRVHFTVTDQTPLTITLVMFGAATLYWIIYGRTPPRHTTPSLKAPPTPPTKFIRYRDMALMIAIWIASSALGVCVAPFVFKTLSANAWSIGEDNVMFAFGLFAASIALLFFSIREFFRLWRS